MPPPWPCRFLPELHDLLAELVQQGGYRNPERLIDQLIQVYDGANLTAGAAEPDPTAAESARATAELLLDAARA